MERQISDRSLVNLLFKTIKEFYLKSENIVSDCKKYDRCRLISTLLSLDEKHEYIRIFCDDKKRKILSIQKPMHLPLCPEPIPSISPWLMNDWTDYRVQVKVQNVNEKTGEKFSDVPERITSFRCWENKRKNWVAERVRLNKIDNIFKSFYTLHNDFQGQSDERELLYAFGLFVDSSDKNICHPLFTKRIRIAYESIEDNIISLFDTDEDIKFESSFFKNISNAKLLHLGEISTDLENTEIHLNQEEGTAEFLKRVIHYLTPNGEFLTQGEEMTQRFIVTYSPMIILRNKNSGIIEYLDKSMDAIQNGLEIPPHLIDLLHPKNKVSGIHEKVETLEKRLAAASGEAPEIFMTKPANKAQLRIAQDIEQNNAVEVQGPPGTGKTHTIANLIGHFLAQGKTILVTSEKIKALSVLRDKLDEEIRPLCVPVFDGNQSEMNDIISSISAKVNVVNIQDLSNNIAEEKNRRNEIIKNLDEERKTIFNIRNKENQNIVYGGQSYSIIEIAKLVAENKEQMHVIPGPVKQKEGLPLTQEEFQKLYASNGELSHKEECELSLPLPDYSKLMVPKQFQCLLDDIDQYEQKKKSITSIDIKNIQENFAENQLLYNNKLLFINPDEDIIQKALNVAESYQPMVSWQFSVVEDSIVGGGYQERWQSLIQSIKDFCQADQDYEGSRLGKQIIVNGTFELDELVENLPEIKEKLANGGFHFWDKFVNSTLSKMTKQIIVDGHTLRNVEEAELAIKKTRRDLAYHTVKNMWAERFDNFTDVPKLERLTGNIVIQLRDYADKINRALLWNHTWYAQYVELLKKTGFNLKLLKSEFEYSKNISGYEHYLTTNIFDYVKIASLFLAERKIRQEIDYAKTIFDDKNLADSDLCHGILKALACRNGAAYEEAYHAYSIVWSKKNIYAMREQLLSKLEKYAFDWAAAIRSRTGSNGQASIPDNLEKLWMLKQFEYLLNELFAMPLEKREKRVDDYCAQLRDCTTRLANQLAWYHLKCRLEGKQEIQSAVASYASLIKRAGKRTGKQAPRLLKQAREQMKMGQKAVPAWIIPVHRALETFDPVDTVFDVAIIDEASQSSLEALVITLMAHKIIVVGDDKQVSPMMVGVNFEERDAILKKYLGPYLKNSLMFDGHTSFYEIVATAFKPVMLEEHFRCVPEIIGYSNEKMYNNRILPLRDSHSSELIPPVINYRVDGRRNGKAKINDKEAECIVSLMLACWEQTEYADKTFGIISLLGDEQAVYIMNFAYNHDINMQEWNQRQVVVGNAASFQGDERDVIFLSMVDDDESANRSRTQLDWRRRYNVAASRAKDQLWVVNSLDYTKLKHGENLEDEDVRFGILEYAVNYREYRARFLEAEVKAESPFEAEVAKYLLAKGYHIQQQYEAGPYRIDIVVSYENKQIAIECDGERFHSGTAKIEEDMERQCILQRIGWKFIRIRGGMYYRDKDGTMEAVIKKLTAYGIYAENVQKNMADDEYHSYNLYQRIVNRAQQIRDEWHKQDEVIKTAANKIVQYPESSISEAPLKAVMSPGNQYKVHYKKEIMGQGTLNLNQKRKIQMGDKVTVKLNGSTKTYIMMENSIGSLTELTQVCLGHSVGDDIIYQNEKGKILGIK